MLDAIFVLIPKQDFFCFLLATTAAAQSVTAQAAGVASNADQTGCRAENVTAIATVFLAAFTGFLYMATYFLYREAKNSSAQAVQIAGRNADLTNALVNKMDALFREMSRRNQSLEAQNTRKNQAATRFVREQIASMLESLENDMRSLASESNFFPASGSPRSIRNLSSVVDAIEKALREDPLKIDMTDRQYDAIKKIPDGRRNLEIASSKLDTAASALRIGPGMAVADQETARKQQESFKKQYASAANAVLDLLDDAISVLEDDSLKSGYATVRSLASPDSI